MRPKVHLVHFSRPGMRKGFPWTIHVKGQCIPAAEVLIETMALTVFRPDKKNHPKAWIRTIGFLHALGEGCYAIRSRP